MPTDSQIATAPPLVIFGEHLPAAAPASSPSARRAAARRARPVVGHLVLPFEQRQKARQRLKLASGREIGVQLPRGTVLRGGDRLRADDGTVIEVVAAPERVSTVRSRDLKELARAAYHLGNRHVALEVGDGWVRYLTDHVLDAMVVQLGLPVVHETEPFEPEAGAYGGHGHGHSQAHARDPAQEREHELRGHVPPTARDDRSPPYVYGPQRGSWHPHGR